MTRFGPWSTTLAFGAVFGLAVAVLLCTTRTNRTANLLLAALILVIVMKLGPYVLGFAGYYDAYPWLSFAPFSAGLALGPLLYLHVLRLTSSALPAGWAWHFAPVTMQVLYRTVLFVQPLTLKNAWNDAVHERWIDPLETFLELASVAIYLVLALRAYRSYQRWLEHHASNREDFRIEWLRNVLLAFAVITPSWIFFEILSYATGFNYYQRFPFYVALTVLIVYLGLEGWRHADRRYPLPAAAGSASATVESPTRDWAAQGDQWLRHVAEAGWWREPELGLDGVARRLGTNTAYLSRALNEGLGLSFNTAVNQLRVAEVQRRLMDSGSAGDLLDLAHAAGFSSKTSFNRVFKAHTGQTPSQYRASRFRERTDR